MNTERAVLPKKSGIVQSVESSERKISKKGRRVRAGILDTALRLFGKFGYDAVSTRDLAAQSGVTLPALQYYFGGKQHLYLACASEVVARFAAITGRASENAQAALAGARDELQLRSALSELLIAVGKAMISQGQSASGGSFGIRELLDPGPGFDLLYAQLWEPGIELVADLIASIRKTPSNSPADRVEAMMLISSLSVFQNGQLVARQALEWDTIDADQFATIEAALRRRIAQL